MSQNFFGSSGPDRPEQWQERQNGANPYDGSQWTQISPGSGPQKPAGGAALPPGYPGNAQVAGPSREKQTRRTESAAPQTPPLTPPPKPPVMPPAPPPEQETQRQQVKITPPSGRRAVPPTGVPDTSRGVPKAVWVVFALVVIAAVGWGISRVTANRGQQYAFVRADNLSSVFVGDALVVRNETLYTQEGVSRVDYKAEEGEEVQRGTTICLAYSSGFSDREMDKLNKNRTQIRSYHLFLLSNITTRDAQMERIENNLLSLAMETQNMVQQHSSALAAQEALLKNALLDRQVYMRQKYPDDQKLANYYDEENRQLQSISAWTKQYAAPFNGIVSFYTDGYESVLNLNNYATYTPPQVRELFRGQLPAGSGLGRNTTAIYRLVRQGSWVILMLADNRDWQPIEGTIYNMLIEGFENTHVSATVESVSRSGGELLVRFSVVGDINIGNVLYMRACSVRVGEDVDSLAVPAKALYSRQGRIGVVISTDSGEYWTAVEVLSVDGDTAHIVPSNPGVLYEGVPVLLFD